MLTATLLVCAFAALTGADDLNNSSAINNTVFNVALSCPVDWKLFGDHCFHLVSRQMTWVDAQKNCETLDANLASIQSIEEQMFVKSFIQLHAGENEEVWIGGSDCQQEFVFFWIDGASFKFTNWCPKEPDNSGKNQHCIQFNYGAEGCWDDVGCSSSRPSVCRKASH
ncbi:Lectin isoform 8 [Scophthalmus maximus]|uniref:Lectin n=2 Tax=Scophthalmus maximus TaxID=52904 RepID=D7PF28_SCOMX|nr:type-2 ice-structuring protein [Scophthalmus maximus]ADI60291.1 lectin [Scophthalmus maximus]AWP01843.1 Lectin isoform 4 [Scophthalmus maximus]AWP01844.1 Lectin isoform 5 [Scophthalmus maximus]AWP01845.1 Lectin isoform 6 [Scophthalmus maximus]AWP01847.1 Lectin isoform 8 [Scophthalmus maximus]